MHVKAAVISIVLLLFFVKEASAQPQAGFKVAGIPGKLPVSAADGPIRICVGTTLTLINTSKPETGDAIKTVTYTYKKGNPASPRIENPPFGDITVTFNSVGVDTIEQVVTEFSPQSKTAKLSLPVLISDTHPDSSFTQPAINCGSNDFKFVARNKDSDPTLSYNWSFGGSSTPNASGSPVTIHFDKAIGFHDTTLSASLLVIDQNGCSSFLGQRIAVHQIPDVNVTSPRSKAVDSGYAKYDNNIGFCNCSALGDTLFSFFNNSSTHSSNTNYNIVWGDKKPALDTGKWLFQSDSILHRYSIGYDTMRVTIKGGNGCLNTKNYTVFVGQNGTIKSENKGNSLSFCVGDTLAFPFSGYIKNANGTLYEFTSNEINPPLDSVIRHASLPANDKDTFYHIFNQTSCGLSVTNGTTTVNNSIAISLNVLNPCGTSFGLDGPMQVSGKSIPDISISPSPNICNHSTITFRNLTSYNGVFPCNKATGDQVWQITRLGGSGGYVINAPSFAGQIRPSWQPGSSSISVTFNTVGRYLIRMYSRVTSPDAFSCDGTTDSSFYRDTIICVRNEPVPQFTLDSRSACVPGYLKIIDAIDTTLTCGQDTYQWDVTPYDSADNCTQTGVGAISDRNIQKPIFTFTKPGRYIITLTVTATGSGCTKSVYDTVRIYQKAGMALKSFPTLCAGDSVKPAASISSIDSCFSLGKVKFTWKIDNGTTSTSNLPDPGFIKYPNGGRWFASLMLSNGCGDTTLHDSMTVSKILVINPVKDTTICSGLPVNISPAGGNSSYFWKSAVLSAPGSVVGNTNVTATPGKPAIDDILTNAANPPGNAKVQYLLYAGSGSCKSNTDTVTVTVLPADTAYAGPDAFLCSGVSQASLQADASKFLKDTGTWSQPFTNATIADVHDPKTKITGLVSGKLYTFVWTLPGKTSKCGILTDTVVISTEPIVNKIDAPGKICPGDPATIIGHDPTGGDNTAYNYQWEESGNGSTFNNIPGANQRDLNITTPKNGEYYTRTITSHGCVVPGDTVKVFITTETPVPSFTAKDSVGCASLGQPMEVAFTNNTPNEGHFSYTWNFGNGSTSTSADPMNQFFKTTVSGYGDTVYYIRLTADNGCVPVVFNDSVKVRSQPAVLFSPDRPIGCSSGTMTFTNVGLRPGTNDIYTWDFGDDTGITTNARTVDHIYHNGPPTTYNVTLSGQNECGNHTDSLKITIDSNHIALNVDVNSTELYSCIPNVVNFKNKTRGASSVTWNFGDRSPQITTIDSFTTVTHTYTVAEVDTVIIKASNFCTDTTTSIIITTANGPKASFTAVPDTVCININTQLNNTSTAGPGIAYSWNFDDGSPLSGENSPAHAYTTGGVYNVQLIAIQTFLPGIPQAYTCTDTATRVVVVDGPTGTLQYTPDSLCLGLPVTFTVISNNASRYTFNFGAPQVAPVATSGNIITYKYLAPGKYLPTVELTGISGRCFTTITGIDSVLVDSVMAGFTYDSTRLCDSTIILFTGNPYAYNGVKDYEWKIGGNPVTAGNPVSAVFKTTTSILAELTVTGNSGCTSQVQKPISVNVHQTPGGDISINSQTCARQTVYFSANIFADNEPLSYAWNLGNGARPTGKDVTTIYSSPITYNIAVTATTDFGCSKTIDSIVTIKTTPFIRITPVDSIILCRGNTTQLVASGAGVDKWNWSPADSLSGSTINNPLVYPIANTIYIASGTNSENCTGTDSILVRVIQPPNVIASPSNISICLPDSIHPVQFFASGAYSYKWRPATWLNSDTVFNPVVTIPQDELETGNKFTYYVTGYDQYQCFGIMDSIILNVGFTPTIEIGTGNDGVAGRKDTIYPKVTNGPFKTYKWSVISGQGKINCLGDPVCAEPQVTILSDVAFKVEAENIFGCSASDTIYYKAFCSNNEQLFLPSGFSPDNDGINDVFMVQGRGIIVEEFKVMNRWGQVVFNAVGNTQPNQPFNGWDGTIKGNKNNPAPPDVYVYYVKVKCTASNEEFTMKNNVTLIRVK